MNIIEHGHKSEVHTVETFNMEDFGFEILRESSGRRPWLQDKDYILNSVNKNNGNKYINPIISLSEDTGKFVIDLLGDTVDVGINSKGYICLQPGTKRKISTSSHRTSGKRANISIGCLRDKLDAIYGQFKRLYLTVQPYGNFNAVIIKPTGEKDE